MQLSKNLEEKIQLIETVGQLNTTAIAVCDAYLEQHPEPTSRWNSDSCWPTLFGMHRSQDAAKKTKKLASSYIEKTTPEGELAHAYSLIQGVPSGSLKDALRSCLDALFRNNQILGDLDVEEDNLWLEEFSQLTPFG